MTNTLTLLLSPLSLRPPRIATLPERDESATASSTHESRGAEGSHVPADPSTQPSRAEIIVKTLIAEFLRPRTLDFF